MARNTKTVRLPTASRAAGASAWAGGVAARWAWLSWPSVSRKRQKSVRSSMDFLVSFCVPSWHTFLPSSIRSRAHVLQFARQQVGIALGIEHHLPGFRLHLDAVLHASLAGDVQRREGRIVYRIGPIGPLQLGAAWRNDGVFLVRF